MKSDKKFLGKTRLSIGFNFSFQVFFTIGFIFIFSSRAREQFLIQALFVVFFLQGNGSHVESELIMMDIYMGIYMVI